MSSPATSQNNNNNNNNNNSVTNNINNNNKSTTEEENATGAKTQRRSTVPLRAEEHDDTVFPDSSPLLHDIEALSRRSKLQALISKKHRHRLYTPREREEMEQYESMDTYEPITVVYKDHLETHYKESHMYIWISIAVFGLVSCLITIGVVSCLHVLSGIKYELLDYGLRGFSFHSDNNNSGDKEKNNISFFKGFLMYFFFCLVCSLLSSVMCFFLPEVINVSFLDVIAYLNGIKYKRNEEKKKERKLFLLYFCGKFFFIIFHVSSGICVGYFDTIIVLCFMVCVQIIEKRYIFFSPHSSSYSTPQEERIIILISIAAGIASSFHVSIGGLMMVIEYISTILPIRHVLYMFVVSVVCSLILQIYFSYVSSFDLRNRQFLEKGELISEMIQLFISHVSFEKIIRMNIIYFFPTIFIGLFCGCFSALFIYVCSLAVKLRRIIHKKLHLHVLRFLLFISFTLMYVSIHYWVAAALSNNNTGSNNEGPCMEVPSTLLTTRNVTVIGYYGVNAFSCPSPHSDKNKKSWVKEETESGTVKRKNEGKILHSYASLAFSSADSALQLLLSWHTEDMLTIPVLLLFLLIYFIFSSLCLSVSFGGDGLFLPSLVIGAVVGRVTGICVRSIAKSAMGIDNISSWADPGCFALIGAGSFLGGVTGLTFSVCIILLESTSDFQHLLPLMLGITIAKKTRELFIENINTILLFMQYVPMLDFEDEIHKYPMFDAKHVMRRDVVTLDIVCKIERVLHVLQTTRHHAFPIQSIRDGRYKGIIVRRQLEILLWYIHLTPSPSVCSYEMGKRIEMHLFYEKLLGTLPPSSSSALEMSLDTQIDLSPYIDHSGFCVLETTTLPRTYIMFRTLGLRHLTVVDSENRIVGIITRKDLVTDRVIEGIVAADEARRLALKKKKKKNTKNKNKNNDKVYGNDNDSFGGSMSGQEVEKEYELYRTGEWIVMGGCNEGTETGRSLENGEIFMHPSPAKVKAIRSYALERKRH